MTKTEEALTAIWVDILQFADVGIHDNFVGLGGDSISAALCANRIRFHFGIDIEIETLLSDSLTLQELAAIVEAETLQAP
jgi:acyl carrier protein